MSHKESQEKYNKIHKDEIKEQQQEYRIKNKEKISERGKLYYQTHRKQILERMDKSITKKEYGKLYYQSNKKLLIYNSINNYTKLKVKFFEMYGKECSCCHEENIDFLTMEHINGGGVQLRNHHGAMAEYRKAIKNYSPKEFSVLCYNCNIGKHMNDNICPHCKINYPETYHRKLRNQFIDMYGGKCACCGEMNIGLLTMDHINGGGHEKRKSGGQYQEFKKAISNYSPNEYQILCYNCNCGKSHRGKGICPHKKV